MITQLINLINYSISSQEKGLDQKIDEAFQPVSDFFSQVIFGSFNDLILLISNNLHKIGLPDFYDSYYNFIADSWFSQILAAPLVILILVGSAIFFTVYFSFPNIKYFITSIRVVSGKYDEVEKDESSSKDGEVSHFQALTTAVSGTVGNGNIAGVALAIALGGPGATFWMIVCGLMGMSLKFVECTLGVHYRDVDENGVVYGGPMYYLTKGLKEKGFVTLGKISAVFFAIFCIGGSFGGGNAAQANQAALVLKDLLGFESTFAGAVIGIILAIVVGVIIIGGIKRIASVTEKIVPFMAVLYILACVYILAINFSFIDDAFSLIITEAFEPTAIGVGGVIGVLMVGFRRAAFSNEAGVGSASIAHSAVKTKYAASEGLVALLEPFIDTVVICTLTALVIITFNSTGVFAYGGEGGVMIDGVMYEGAGITSKAFAEYIPFSDVFLTTAVVLFAVSTMISWSYYGIQSWKYLFGKGKVADMVYKLMFLAFIVIGSAASMNSIWAFSDAMIFAMVFPNMIGLYFLFPVVREQLDKYLKVIKEFKV
tara:strand:+ start:83 stop:1708 length:1626 start_codon:yes stop_codon:yes gene_type:complete